MKTIAELNAKIKELEKDAAKHRKQLQKNVASLPPGVDRVKLGRYVDENNARIDDAVARGRAALGAEFWAGARAREDETGNEPLRRALSNKTLEELNEEARIANLKAKGVYGPAHKSSKAAFDAGFDPRVGVGQLLSLPLMVTDIAETGLDALRGTRSPSRWAQGTDLISRALGGPKYYQEREPSIYDWQQTAAEISNPVNFVGALPGLARRGARSALNLSDAAVRKIARDPRATAMAAIDAAGELSPLNAVVKQKGGNWLSGSVEDALQGLRREARRPPRVGENEVTDEMWAEYLRNSPDQAVNAWVSGPLTKYVKNQMATPEDPVRALAEKGVLHFTPGWVPEGDFARGQAAGLHAADLFGLPPGAEYSGPGSRLGKSKLAQDWEDLTDQGLEQYMAGSAPSEYAVRKRSGPGDLGWLSKLDPETPVYAMPRGMEEALGLPHLVDELRNATRADSDLPRQLQIAPEKLGKMNMEAAVQHVAKINEWRAKNAAEANAKIANNAATQLVREYVDDSIPNPKGLRWVELRSPNAPKTVEELSPEEFERYQDYIKGGVSEGRALKEAASKKTLSDALKYEGDTMGHCVGGYCDDVASGESRIFSLRDAKGEPHVTVEVVPTTAVPYEEFRAANKKLISSNPRLREADKYYTPPKDRNDRHYLDAQESYVAQMRRIFEEEGLTPVDVAPQTSNRIQQVKGKQNRAPSADYLPFVQDFVRNSPLGTPWSEVGDLGNTGLKDLRNFGNEPMIVDAIKQRGAPFVTQEEWDQIMGGVRTPQNYAHGGRVTTPRTTAELQAIIADIGGRYAADQV